MRQTTTGARSLTADLVVVILTACVVPVFFFLTLGAVLSTGPRGAIAVLVAPALVSLVLWWRSRRRTSSAGGPKAASTRHGAIRRVRRWAETVLALGAASTLAGLAVSAISIKPPAQELVVERFQEHRPDFETLRKMALADGLSIVSGGGEEYASEPSPFPMPPEEAGINAERADGYRRLLSAVGCSALYVSRTGEVSFPIAAWGAANRGWRLSLSWLPEPPAELVPTVDGLPTTRGEVVYSHVEENWYVAFIW